MGLIQRPLFLAQIFIFRKSEFILLTHALIPFKEPLLYIWTSSAYICILQGSKVSGKSLIYKQNNRGPSTEPCGIPLLTSRLSEHIPLQSETSCFQEAEKFFQFFQEYVVINYIEGFTVIKQN